MPEQHFGNVEGVPDEDFFRVLERSKPYKQMQKLIQKALADQWNSILFSGIINTIYNKYKTFFVKPRGKKVKINKNFIKADEEDVRSESDLKELEREKLQGDKFMVGENALKMAPFLLFLGTQVENKSKSVGSYYGFRKEFRDYLKTTTNKAGQTIIDQIPTPKPIKFRLSNKMLKEKIAERVDKLVKGLDDVTRRTMVKELAKGIKLKETKAQMIKRLQQKGTDLSKLRAKRIVTTETEAVAEFMRWETARMNGVTHKTWETAQDERVCPVCSPLNGKTVPIDKPFPDVGVSYPPAHVMCRCSAFYDVNNSMCSDFITKSKKFSISDMYDSFFKAKDDLYQPDKGGGEACVNENNVWAGGESAVGSDKDINKYYSEMKNLEEKGVLPSSDRYQDVLASAQVNLSDAGYAQLRKKLGYTGKIFENMPKDFYTTWGRSELAGISDKKIISLMNKYKFTEAEVRAASFYTHGDSWQSLNRHLRNNAGSLAKIESEKLRVLGKYLDKGLAKLPTDKAGTYYRGIMDLDTSAAKKMISDLKKSKEFISHSYMSTSPTKEVAEKFAVYDPWEKKSSIIFEIEGKSGKNITDLSSAGDSEVLFGRNTKFKVMKIAIEVSEIDPETGADGSVYKVFLKEILSKAKKKNGNALDRLMQVADNIYAKHNYYNVKRKNN